METEAKQDGNSEAEVTSDIPSDFFDDFNKAEFIEGLNVIDSWDDLGVVKSSSKPPSSRSRIDAEAVDSVRDLRELIRDGKQDRREKNEGDSRKKCTPGHVKSTSNDLDNFIKPGSRRDPEKTNEAIKKDKDMKVKEYLAKSLESNDDIRPPGTELDDFFVEAKTNEKVKVKREVRLESHRNRSRSPKERLPRESPRRPVQRRMRESPVRRHESPVRLRDSRRSPRRFSPKRSPGRRRRNLSPSHQFSPSLRFSPGHHSSGRRSPNRRSPGRHYRRSRSPVRRSPDHRTSSSSYRSVHHQSPMNTDNFLYPTSSSIPFEENPSQLYLSANQAWDVNLNPEYPVAAPVYSYPNMVAPLPGPAYSGGYGESYEYAVQQGLPAIPGPGPYIPPPSYVPMVSVPVPQPVPAPVSVPAPMLGPPEMVPAPPLTSTSLALPKTMSQQQIDSNKRTPYDALAQLVADGKISKEDYLKLTPNKGKMARLIIGSIGSTSMDLKEKVDLLGRCHNAVSKLALLHLPNKLVMHNNMLGQEPKILTQKFCSPLKRQPPVEFHFTRTSGTSTAHQNKQLIDSIIATIGLNKVLTKPKKADPNHTKEIAVQTTKPQCDVCEIRNSTKLIDASTTTQPEYFSKSVHTQVVDQDLVNSKAVFNPSGGIAEGATMSIAHMTPAQLVSQLAARAKTLKQPEPESSSQYSRRNPNSYDYDRGSNQYNYGNYDYHRY